MHEIALQVACPWCQAQPGHPCTVRVCQVRGWWLWKREVWFNATTTPHFARMGAASSRIAD